MCETGENELDITNERTRTRAFSQEHPRETQSSARRREGKLI